jgi:hypothetical protein
LQRHIRGDRQAHSQLADRRRWIEGVKTATRFFTARVARAATFA